MPAGILAYVCYVHVFGASLLVLSLHFDGFIGAVFMFVDMNFPKRNVFSARYLCRLRHDKGRCDTFVPMVV